MHVRHLLDNTTILIKCQCHFLWLRVYNDTMDSKQRLALIIAVLASLVAFLDGSVVNVALPAITRDLGGGLPMQQWVVDSYMITLGSLMLLAGSLSDVYGRIRILRTGLIGFLVCSLLCAIAPSGVFLVVARALQGLGAALLVPSSLALIVSTFSGAAQGRAIGLWTAWTGIAFLIGPLLGGVFVDAGSWRFIFAINVLPVVATLWLMRKLDHQGHHSAETKLDVVGASLCSIGLGSFVYGLIEQNRYGWANPIIIVALVGGALLLALFWYHERRTEHPMLPPVLFRERNFLVGNLATISIYAGLSIATFLLAIFVQQVGDYSALQAGLSIMPVTIIMFFLSPRFGKLAGTYGPRWFMAAGPVIAALGFVSMLRVDGSVQYFSQLFPGILLFGLGLSITVAPLTAAVLGAVAPNRAGIASAVNNMIARVAGLVGIALIGLVASMQLSVPGFHRAVIVTACLLALGGVTSAIWIKNDLRHV